MQPPTQLAASALRSCSITQQQLAGLDAAGAAAGAAGGQAGLLFVDPEMLQLDDPQQRSIKVQGLKVRTHVHVHALVHLHEMGLLRSCTALMCE